VRRDRGETNDIAASRPEVVNELSAHYDRWWESVQPSLVNEDAVGPKENPFKALYREQLGEE
jgi:arylsulfatase